MFSQAITDSAPFVEQNTLDAISISGVSGRMKKKCVRFFGSCEIALESVPICTLGTRLH